MYKIMSYFVKTLLVENVTRNYAIMSFIYQHVRQSAYFCKRDSLSKLFMVCYEL